MENGIFKKAADALEKHKKDIILKEGVHGVSIGDGASYGISSGPCIVIYVGKSASVSELQGDIEGFPVVLEETDGFSAL